MFKVCVIGAGAIGFTRGIVKDILSIKEFQNTVEFAFFDISAQYLDYTYKLVLKDIESNGLTNKVVATTDRLEALKDAKYVLNFARVGMTEAFETDIMIPLKYGIDQCVGDTLCAGGIMYGQRGIAVMLDICKDIKKVARDDVLFLNYGNPNAMLTGAINTFGGVKCLGLCHGVQHGSYMIARILGIPHNELDYICAGINHQTWYIRLAHKGRVIGSDELLRAFENNPDCMRTEKVRIDMLKRFGYFSTESNGHLSEYVPWYRKRKDDIINWVDTSCWINGETGGYLREIKAGRNYIENEFDKIYAQPAYVYDTDRISDEHASQIIRGLETDFVYRGHFNVINNGVITNLPYDAVVEVPGYIDRNGINIPVVGDLPLGCAAVCNASISVQRLAVHAAVKGDDFLLRQAFMMDPLTGAVCNPPEIWQLVDEMLVAQEKWLPQYKKAIAEAKVRLADKSKLIPTDENYKGGALRPQDMK